MIAQIGGGRDNRGLSFRSANLVIPTRHLNGVWRSGENLGWRYKFRSHQIWTIFEAKRQDQIDKGGAIGQR